MLVITLLARCLINLFGGCSCGQGVKLATILMKKPREPTGSAYLDKYYAKQDKSNLDSVRGAFSLCKLQAEAKNGPQCAPLAKQCYETHIKGITKNEMGDATLSCPKVNEFVACLGESCYNGQDAAPYNLYVAKELGALCKNLLKDASCEFFSRATDMTEVREKTQVRGHAVAS